MALILNSSIPIENIMVKVAGDIGDLQITEVSDSESDCEQEKQNVSRAVSISNIPSSLDKSEIPIFGSVAVSNSENVQFGNNTYFNGPVTIKQIIKNKSGVDNPAYNRSGDDTADVPSQTKLDETPIKTEQILLWHKLTFSAICISVLGGILAIILVLQYNPDEQTNIISEPDVTPQHSVPASTVVGNWFESNVQVIIITVIMFPLTFLLISYLLLTKEVASAGMVIKKNRNHENCVIRGCIICNEEDPLIIAPHVVRTVSRTDWLAQPVEGELDKLNLPVPWVIITHTATESCYSQSQCVLRVRLIQTFHIESRGWDDIGYNFLVGGDGSVYYGRGWDYEGAHTKYYNKYSIGIAFIGTFNNDPPPKQQVEACKRIIRQGVQLGKIAGDYKLLAHRQLMSTLSPGDKVVEIIKEWPHYVQNDADIQDLLPSRALKGS